MQILIRITKLPHINWLKLKPKSYRSWCDNGSKTWYKKLNQYKMLTWATQYPVQSPVDSQLMTLWFIFNRHAL